MRITFNNRDFDLWVYSDTVWQTLPTHSGIYIFRVLTNGNTDKKIEYIGSTKYFLIRMRSHLVLRKIKRELKEGQSIEILFSFCSCWHKMREIEAQFIKKYKPTYNSHFKGAKKRLHLI